MTKKAIILRFLKAACEGLVEGFMLFSTVVGMLVIFSVFLLKLYMKFGN
jgi:hypothetical protein